MGYTKYKGELLQGAHVALIEDDLFEKCQHVRARRRRRTRAIGEKKRTYIFSGIARCRICGLPLRCQSTQSKGKWRYYKHDAQVRGYECAVPSKMIRADRLENQWSYIVSKIILPDDWLMRIEELTNNADEIEAILHERNETEERMRRLARLYRDLLIDEIDYRETLKKLKKHLDSMVVPQNATLIEAGNYVEQLEGLWAAASLEEQRDLTRIMIRTLKVDIQEEQIIAIEPHGAFRLLLESVCRDVEVRID